MLVKIPHMNLSQIAELNQCHRWIRLNDVGEKDRYRVFYDNMEVFIEDIGDSIFKFSCSEEEYDRVWKGYFDLDTDYAYINSLLPEWDGFLSGAIRLGYGIRVLRQDLWETGVYLILRQSLRPMKAHNEIESLCCFNDWKFPSPEELLKILGKPSWDGWQRAEYLRNFAEFCIETSMGRDLYNLPHKKALSKLAKVQGVGRNIASYLCLYCLHMLEVSYLDNTMHKVLVEDFGGRTKSWMTSEYAGYYQMLCVYYKRNKKDG